MYCTWVRVTARVGIRARVGGRGIEGSIKSRGFRVGVRVSVGVGVRVRVRVRVKNMSFV